MFKSRIVIMLSILFICLFTVQAHSFKGDNNTSKDYITESGYGMTGCLNIEGLPITNSKVILKQKGERKQKTTTDDYGCYDFEGAVPDKDFRIIIKGTVARHVPLPTTYVVMYLNLDSKDTVPMYFDVNDPEPTSNFTVPVTVYDSLLARHTINIYFRKSQTITAAETPDFGAPFGGVYGATWGAGYPALGGTEWIWYAVVSGADNANSFSDQVQAQGRLEFNTNGALYYKETLFFPTGGFDFAGGTAQNQPIFIDFGDDIAMDVTLGLEGTTQFGTGYAIKYLLTD